LLFLREKRKTFVAIIHPPPDLVPYNHGDVSTQPLEDFRVLHRNDATARNRNRFWQEAQTVDEITVQNARVAEGDPGWAKGTAPSGY